MVCKTDKFPRWDPVRSVRINRDGLLGSICEGILLPRTVVMSQVIRFSSCRQRMQIASPRSDVITSLIPGLRDTMVQSRLIIPNLPWKLAVPFPWKHEQRLHLTALPDDKKPALLRAGFVLPNLSYSDHQYFVVDFDVIENVHAVMDMGEYRVVAV